MFGLISGVFLVAFGAIVVVAIVAFPFVGLALLPVFLIALLAVIGFGYRFASRGPEGLPERTTSPSEPEELGRPR